MSGGSGKTHSAAALTHRTIEALRPTDGPYRVPDQRCIGLAVRVAPNGVKTWDLAYRIRGAAKTRRLSLGRVSDISLENARARANELTSAARMGRDLIDEEEESVAAAAKRLTVETLIELYLRRRVTGRLRTAREIERRLTRALRPLLSDFATDIKRRGIRELLDATADQGYEREAEKRRQTIGAMFRWALAQDMVDIDPTAGLKAYDPGTPRDRVLDKEEIKSIWKWLNSDVLPPERAIILKLQLLIGARCGEISGLRVEEIDQTEWVWTLPSARSKNKRPRSTPLVGMAKQIIEERIQLVKLGPLFTAESGVTLTSGHVGQSLWARRHRLPIAKFNTHDLRRTVATMFVELGCALDLVAAILGHETGGRDVRTLTRHYVRTDLIPQKREALLTWDKRVSELIGLQTTEIDKVD